MRRLSAILLALAVLVVAAWPAESADSTAKRLRKLEKRVNALALLAIDDPNVAAYSTPMSHFGNGFYVGTARCERNGFAVGGGIFFGRDQVAASNRIHYSYQADERSWKAAVDAFSPSGLPFVQVVCLAR